MTIMHMANLMERGTTQSAALNNMLCLCRRPLIIARMGHSGQG